MPQSPFGGKWPLIALVVSASLSIAAISYVATHPRRVIEGLWNESSTMYVPYNGPRYRDTIYGKMLNDAFYKKYPALWPKRKALLAQNPNKYSFLFS